MTEGDGSAVGILLAILLINWLAELLCWGRRYQYYYHYMKDAHPIEWRRLMLMDSMVEAFGEWFRWPFGSWQLVAFYHNRRSNLGDQQWAKMKAPSRHSLLWLLISFGLLIGGLPAIHFVF